jgi:thioesterase domain-containing protein
VEQTIARDQNVSSSLVMMSLARLARLAQETQLTQGAAIAPRAPQVVRIRQAPATGAAPPLVLVHPIGGSIIPYRDLSSGLKPDRAIYGIQTQADEERNTLRHSSIGDVAEDYIEQLAQLELGPRVVLGGYSLGGAVAFDMARRMLERGLAVDTVLIIDTPARIRRPELASDQPVTTSQLLMFGQILAGRLGRELRIDAAELETLPTAERIQRLLGRLHELKIIGDASDNGIYHGVYQMARHNERLQRNFEPRHFAGHLSLVRTLEEVPELRAEANEVYDDPSFGWQSHCAQAVDIRHVPGSHFQLLYPPYIRGLAVALQQILTERSPAL